MKILVITENYYPIVEPTAKIVERLTKSTCFQDCSFIILSKGSRNQKTVLSPFVTNFQIPDYLTFEDRPIIVKAQVFLYKLFSRVFALFFPRDLYDSKRFYKAALKIIKKEKIDRVIAVSGWFSTQKAANLIYSKTNIPFSSFYTDPFLFNIGKQKYSFNKLQLLEKKWLKNTTRVYMPSNYLYKYYSIPNYWKNKFTEIELPCFYSTEEIEVINSQKPNYTILHAGSFFTKIREPNKLFELANLLTSIPELKFESLGYMDKHLSKVHENKIPNNFDFSERLEGNNLLKKIGQASLLVVVDNVFGIQIPSKTFEYISTGKPILLIYSNYESETLKILKRYPRCFFIHENDCLNDYTIKRISELVFDTIPPLDISEIQKIFPNFTSNRIFGLIRKTI